jgi:hypothetical protein
MIVQDIAITAARSVVGSSRLQMLAGRASEAMRRALNDAAGFPYDDAWHAAYECLNDYVECCVALGPGTTGDDSLDRLRCFLRENDDLAQQDSRLLRA